jgi:hypothetical protein
MGQACLAASMPTVYLTDALPDARTTIDADVVELRGNVLRIEPWDDTEQLVVPLERLAGIEGGEIEREVERTPTQGGQYTEVVTTIA